MRGVRRSPARPAPPAAMVRRDELLALHSPLSRSADPQSRSADPQSRSADPQSRSADPQSRSGSAKQLAAAAATAGVKGCLARDPKRSPVHAPVQRATAWQSAPARRRQRARAALPNERTILTVLTMSAPWG